MGKYIILNEKKKVEAYSDGLWLARLYSYNRHKNLNYNIFKIKDNEFVSLEVKNPELQIHYFHGYAMTDREIEYIDYELSRYVSLDKAKKLKTKYKTKRVEKFIKEYKETYIDFIFGLIDMCIDQPAIVIEYENQKHFFESIK